MHQTSRSNPPAMPVPSPADNNFSLNKIWMKTKEEKATTSHLGSGGAGGQDGTWQVGRQGIFVHQGSVLEDIANDEEDLFYTILPYFMVRSTVLSFGV